MKYEDVVSEIGEATGLSFGKVDELLTLMNICLSYEHKKRREFFKKMLCHTADTDMNKVITTFRKVQENEKAMRKYKADVDHQRNMQKICRNLVDLAKLLG